MAFTVEIVVDQYGRAAEFYTSIGQKTVRLNKEMPGQSPRPTALEVAHDKTIPYQNHGAPSRGVWHRV